MGKRIKYKCGEVVGECVYIKEADKNKHGQRRAIFKCRCGNEFKSDIFLIKSLNTKSCGCRRRINSSIIHKKHGLRSHWLYQTWKGMRSRCLNNNNKYYGGRGITICEEWKHDPVDFIKYITSLPGCGQEGMSIDRIDNNGNYEPGNIRWATHRDQSMNTRKKPNNSTGYFGISKVNNKFRARIWYNMKVYHIGYFKTKLDAVKSRDEFIISSGFDELSLNKL